MGGGVGRGRAHFVLPSHSHLWRHRRDGNIPVPWLLRGFPQFFRRFFLSFHIFHFSLYFYFLYLLCTRIFVSSFICFSFLFAFSSLLLYIPLSFFPQFPSWQNDKQLFFRLVSVLYSVFRIISGKSLQLKLSTHIFNFVSYLIPQLHYWILENIFLLIMIAVTENTSRKT